jgi:hypothetical protein
MITALNRQQTRPIKKSSSLKPRSRRSKSHGQASLSNYGIILFIGQKEAAEQSMHLSQYKVHSVSGLFNSLY